MKTIAFLSIGFLFVCGALVSNPVRKSAKPNKVKFPFGTWMRSQEEDKDPNASWLLYRPDSYDFPPARGRSGFTLLKDGTFTLIQPSPVDGREEKSGKWTLVSPGLFKISVQGSSLSELRWKLKEKGIMEVEMK
jgi:hypothetical protein